MRASSPLSFEAGTSTVSWAARIALRTRVRKSAIGSVMDMGCLLLPGGLGHPGDLAVVSELAKADAAHPELAIHRARTTAAGATSIGTCFVFGRPRLLDALRGLGHQSVLS